MKFKIRLVNLLLFLLVFPLEIFSQGPPPPPAGGPGPPPPPGLPIDGGLWILAASAVYIGVKKMRNK